ncbi:hypothetical protein [Lentilactobacillus kefiri]|uniref:Uncharacterized protein n=2 Tax=Lentilactobacillus kefiri TaxID=33962 RepID=A0A8E1RHN3_LENKE|nr:hypothetical protein [Lentilactobacillus kefiri]KRM50227.1 hypothetical protein FC95_GL002069 [Lentilactobacillus kefiri DSM 20587 = JCM 5818]MCJ2162437.1 hypothetical protein [Lentilactobacillus kefiri]MCP9369875.1 hypothetical protein [Lentilactobacillus kefiri]MDH5109505.1 hypothetical protein [Lentilactobacillus kefiri]PAK58507.1 hypothetical protein B9K02_11240 [Lentilactobacillus kefiri]
MKFKKTLLFVASLILFGVVAGPSVTANAKTLTGMPRSFRHVWYRGHLKLKITKYHIYTGTKGHHYSSHTTFKRVIKDGKYYTPYVKGGFDLEPYHIFHGYLYHGTPLSQGGSGTIRYHR